MISSILLVAVGVFVGWAVPQPAWAKTIQDKVTGFFKG